jgi:hypothetical protein
VNTKLRAPAGTLTIERVRDVPELAKWLVYSDDLAPVVIERDEHGAFVEVRVAPWGYIPSNIWDHTRLLADKLGLRYVGPGREMPANAAQVEPGWMVWVPGLPGGRWLFVAKVVERYSTPEGAWSRRIVTTLGQTLTVGADATVRVRKPVGGAR